MVYILKLKDSVCRVSYDYPLVTIVIRLVGSVYRDAEIVLLFGVETSQLYSQMIQMSSCYLFIQLQTDTGGREEQSVSRATISSRKLILWPIVIFIQIINRCMHTHMHANLKTLTFGTSIKVYPS